MATTRPKFAFNLTSVQMNFLLDVRDNGCSRFATDAEHVRHEHVGLIYTRFDRYVLSPRGEDSLNWALVNGTRD